LPEQGDGHLHSRSRWCRWCSVPCAAPQQAPAGPSRSPHAPAGPSTSAAAAHTGVARPDRPPAANVIAVSVAGPSDPRPQPHPYSARRGPWAGIWLPFCAASRPVLASDWGAGPGLDCRVWIRAPSPPWDSPTAARQTDSSTALQPAAVVAWRCFLASVHSLCVRPSRHRIASHRITAHRPHPSIAS
jgi:hypothetical protein